MTNQSSFFYMDTGTDFTKRKYSRIVYTASVDISSVKIHGVTYKGLVKNISMGGLAVETENELAMGDEFRFAFFLSDKHRIKVLGKIVWEYKDKNSNNYGVQFTRVGFFGRFRLKRFIDERFRM